MNNVLTSALKEVFGNTSFQFAALMPSRLNDLENGLTINQIIIARYDLGREATYSDIDKLIGVFAAQVKEDGIALEFDNMEISKERNVITFREAGGSNTSL